MFCNIVSFLAILLFVLTMWLQQRNARELRRTQAALRRADENARRMLAALDGRPA